MTSHAAAERAALCDLFESVGPAAPTLCAGWDTADLAAHLAARDRVPAVWAGLLLRPLAGSAAAAQDRFKAAHSYLECVALVRGGAPRWSPMGLPGLREAINLVEYAVHHEDVRRAQPGWAPRTVPAGLADALWRALRIAGRPAFRRAADGVVLVRAGSGERMRAAAGALTVTLVGEPMELVLYASGRRSVARVEVAGDDAAVARLAAARLAL